MLFDTSSLVVEKINRSKLKLRTRCNNISEIPFTDAHLSSLNKLPYTEV